MGTTAEKLAYLSETKTEIKNAIAAKGVSVPDGATFRQYADLISGISTGLSDADLALANATPEDVTAGKTFYAGDRTLKTGAAEKGYKIVTGYTPNNSITINQPGIVYAFAAYTGGGETKYQGGSAGASYSIGTATLRVDANSIRITAVSTSYVGYSYIIISQ